MNPLSDRARDWLFRILYAHSLNPKPPEKLVDDVEALHVVSDEAWAQYEQSASPYRPNLKDGKLSSAMWARIGPHVTQALTGIIGNRDTLDSAIQAASARWRLDRMPTVDRSLLVIGCYELLIAKATPARRVINRTVELAKRYGEADSKRFINGILDQIRKDHGIEPN